MLMATNNIDLLWFLKMFYCLIKANTKLIVVNEVERLKRKTKRDPNDVTEC